MAVDAVLTSRQVAERYQVVLRTVLYWRQKGTGPRYFYAGRYVRYRMTDLLDWEKAESLKAAS
jgi:hypothetical protein